MIDRAEIERLIAEAREADARMTPVPWVAEGGVLYHDSEDDGTLAIASLADDACVDDDIAIARTRNNLPAMAAALTQLLAEVDHHDQMLASAARSAGESSAERDGLAAAVREAGRQLDAMTRERDAARAESTRLQAMVDQLVTARDAARVEAERLQSLAAIGDLTVQVRDLDELCMDHVSNDDEVGADAEGRLVTAVEIRARLIEAYRASKEPR